MARVCDFDRLANRRCDDKRQLLPAEWDGWEVADGHAIIWPFADPRTYKNPQIGMSTPNDPDLRQIQAWVGSGPYPPIVP